MNFILKYTTFISFMLFTNQVLGDYAQGCNDPEYAKYVAGRFAHFDSVNKHLSSQTLLEYQNSLKTSANPFRVISDLSRHLKYSAQFDPVDITQAKIERLLTHGDELRTDQQLAVRIFDGFGDEDHAIGIARAWIAYKQGDTKTAFSELLASIDGARSATLSTFGPDIYFIRHILKDGHTQSVLDYLKLTEQFWQGDYPNNMRYIWRAMIAANCQVAFESLDATKALELGLRVRDVRRALK